MAVTHRPIPSLPTFPRAKAIAKDIRRSYTTGRKEISRAFAGHAFEISITAGEEFPPNVRANLVTMINAADGKQTKIPFTFKNSKTLTCQIVPAQTGLFSFWTQFSLDNGKTWQHDPVPDAWVLVDPAQVDALRMYTLIPSVSGTIEDWSAELIKIKAMGFNAVHFLPLTTLDTSLSPYSAKTLFDVDPSYVATGPGKPSGLEQLEALITHAKALGLKLCFDLVLNHVGTDSDIATLAPEWIVPDQDSPDGNRRARYWSGVDWQSWHDLVLINFEHPSQGIRADILSYMHEYALFWAKYASETDGFVRFDNLHSSEKDFVDALSVKLHAEYPNVGIIAEYFTDAGTMLDTVPKWGLSLILATPWDSRFVNQLREYLRYIHSISDHVRFFMPITSHDSGTPKQEFASAQATIPRYVSAALMGTGATGITQGVEWGQPEKIEFIGRQLKLIGTAEPIFGEFLRKVNGILDTEPAFRRGDNCLFVDGGHHAVIAMFRKENRPGRLGFLVVCNFDIMGEQEIQIDLAAAIGVDGPVQCVDLIDDATRFTTGPQLTLRLPACGVHVLSLRTVAPLQ